MSMALFVHSNSRRAQQSATFFCGKYAATLLCACCVKFLVKFGVCLAFGCRMAHFCCKKRTTLFAVRGGCKEKAPGTVCARGRG
jgi:hypothetical protein